MKAQTKETQASLTPDKALEILKEGNKRFTKNSKADRNLLEQVKDTQGGQYPFAVILSCIDSRVPAEIVFDQGIGDVFSARVAGNIVDEDIIGSIEYGCKVAGSKLVLVLGHTSCGAVKGACDNVELGNITSLVSKIKPAVAAVKEPTDESLRNSSNIEFVNEVSKTNVHHTLDNLRKQSPLLSEMENDGSIKIVGAMYDVSTGNVTFYN
ncbi:carbonic anhydrase [Marixanthomonas sp. SCSIO 43207]|uniref:carbonic anhydrase family protein n=1 Tax=Marixanthomonas sp. SCSIO 43207 TaxID=2779360 RepID=UPI001CA7F1CD|nr:carbonic anhydrase family protein [Marixanthomonas sp. SCSIO 43207]UAB81989.1 carbonic anhydrase [Marixanthomonas sp. SCSIO 43207]